MEILSVWFDGSCLPKNPGRKTVGACIIKKNNQIIYSKSLPEEHQTDTSCNYAEYVGLMLAIEWLVLQKLTKEKIIIFGDSDLVIRQMNGHWRIKEGLYSNVAKYVKFLIIQHNFTNITFTWIPRLKNTEADELTKWPVNLQFEPSSEPSPRLLAQG